MSGSQPNRCGDDVISRSAISWCVASREVVPWGGGSGGARRIAGGTDALHGRGALPAALAAGERHPHAFAFTRAKNDKNRVGKRSPVLNYGRRLCWERRVRPVIPRRVRASAKT